MTDMHHHTPVYAVLGMKPRESTHARQVLYQLNHTPSLRLSLYSWISCLFEAGGTCFCISPWPSPEAEAVSHCIVMSFYECHKTALKGKYCTVGDAWPLELHFPLTSTARLPPDHYV